MTTDDLESKTSYRCRACGNVIWVTGRQHDLPMTIRTGCQRCGRIREFIHR